MVFDIRLSNTTLQSCCVPPPPSPHLIKEGTPSVKEGFSSSLVGTTVQEDHPHLWAPQGQHVTVSAGSPEARSSNGNQKKRSQCHGDNKFTRFTRLGKCALSNALPAASPLIMHSKFEQRDKQSDNSPLLSVQGEPSQSCPLQQRSKGHRPVPLPDRSPLKKNKNISDG